LKNLKFQKHARIPRVFRMKVYLEVDKLMRDQKKDQVVVKEEEKDEHTIKSDLSFHTVYSSSKQIHSASSNKLKKLSSNSVNSSQKQPS